MAGDLTPRSSGQLVGWQFRNELRAVNSYGALALGADQQRAALVEQRIDNALYLAGKAAIGMTSLNGLVTALSKDNPGLEMGLRHIEERVTIGIGNVIAGYLSQR